MNFYQKFVKVCTQKGVSPSSVAYAAGFDKSVVTYWKKHEKVNPKAETITKIADALGVAPAVFFSDEYAKKSAQNQKYIESILAGEIKAAPDGRTLNELLEEEKQEEYRVVAEVYSGQIKEHLMDLNENGMREAVKRVQELTNIPDYQKDKNA